MTVSSATNRMPTYTGAGTTDTFAYTFYIASKNDLLVVQTVTATGVETEHAVDTDYTVTGVGDADGGTVVLTAGNLATGQTLDIRRKTTLLQPTDLRNQGVGFPGTAETALDKLTHIAQQQQDELDRSLKFGESESGNDSTFPAPSASKYIGWNSGGTALENKTPGSVALATPATDSVTTATILNEAVTTAKIDDEAVTAAKIADNAVTTAKIDDGAVTLAKRTKDWSLDGLKITNNATDANNDIDIAAGSCRDSADAEVLTLASALVKRIDATWAVGTNQGGLDTGSAAAGTFYAVWLIKRSDTGVVDVLISASFTAPTMPASYDLKRRIGWVATIAGSAVLSKQSTEGLWTTIETAWWIVNDASITTNVAETVQAGPPYAIAHVFALFTATSAMTAGDSVSVVVRSTENASSNGDDIILFDPETDATAAGLGGRGHVQLDASGELQYMATFASGTVTLRMAVTMLYDAGILRGV